MRAQVTLYAIVAILILVAIIVLWHPIQQTPIPLIPVEGESVTTMIQSCLDQAILLSVEDFGWQGSYRLGEDTMILGNDPATADHFLRELARSYARPEEGYSRLEEPVAKETFYGGE